MVRVAVGVPTVAEEAAGLGVPEEDSEEREFKRQWARTPKRICIFVEPSPFASVPRPPPSAALPETPPTFA